MEVSRTPEVLPMPEDARFHRRQFCASVAAAGALGAIGGLSSQSLAANSLATAGELKPIFENIVCRWTPENPRHDHPKIIRYRLDDGSLVAEVEGDEGRQVFRFRDSTAP